MTSDRSERLLALVRELLEESGCEPEVLEGGLDANTSLLRSELLDSLALLQIAEWISDELPGELDLESIDLRAEWDSISDILAFIDRRA